MHRILVLMVLALALMSCWRDPMDRAKALSAVAAYQAEAGETAAARESIALAMEMLRDFGHGDDPEALRAIAWAQAKTGDIIDARATGRGRVWHADSLGLVAIVQIQKGDSDGARETLRIALGNITEGGRIPETVILAQGLLGDMREAVANCRQFPGENPALSVLPVLAGLQAEAGDLAGMETTLTLYREQMEPAWSSDLETRLAGTMLETLVRATGRDWSGAYETIDEFEALLRDRAVGNGHQDTARAIASSIRHLVRAREALHRGDKETAWQAFQEAGEAAAIDSDSLLRNILGLAVLTERALAGDKSVLQDMDRMTKDPKIELSAFAVVALARAVRGDAAGAEEAIARAAAEALDGAADTENLYPSVAAQARLVLGDKAGALRILGQGNPGTEPAPVETVIRALAGEVRQATMLAMDWFIHNDLLWSEDAIGQSALLARAGDYDKARQTALGIASAESTDDLRQRSARLAMRLQQPDEAMAWLMEIPDEQNRLKALLALAKAMVAAGRADDARRVARAAESTLYRLDKTGRDSETEVLAGLLTKLGEPDRALQIADDLLSAGRQVAAYREVAKGLAARGNMADARIVLARAADLALGMSSARSRALEFPRIAVDRAALGDRKGALADARQARQAVQTIAHANGTEHLMAEVARAFSAAGSPAEADETMMLAVNIASRQISVTALLSIAQVAGEANLPVWKNEALTRAWSAAARIKDDEDRSAAQQRIRCLRTGCAPEKEKEPFSGILAGISANPLEHVREAVALARKHADTGNSHAAQTTVDRAVASIGTLDDPLLRAKAWILVAEFSRETGHDTAAARHLNHATEELAADNAAWYRAWTLIGIAESHERAGHRARALDTARQAVAALREP